MTGIAAIVLDIDGTLLNSQGYLSQATWLALRARAEQGIPLYVATARPLRLVFRAHEVPRQASFLSERGVFYNGAWAIDRTLDCSAHWPLRAELVVDLTGYLATAAPDVQVVLQHQDAYHAFRTPPDKATRLQWGFRPEELIPFEQARQHACSKIVSYHPSRQLDALYRDLCTRYDGEINVFMTDGGRWVQCMSGEASKERALLYLLARRQIDPQEVVVFGNDMPDAGMFRTFGRSVAMANAPEALKAIATFVTRSNDEDGIAFALDHLL